MHRADRHQHDLVQWLQQADPVHHARAQDVEAREGLLHHGLDRLLGHAGVMLELHRRDRRALVAVAHGADEAANRTDGRHALAQGRDFCAQVEVLVADADAGAALAAGGWFSGRHAQPPVTGGKKASSAPGRKAASSLTMT